MLDAPSKWCITLTDGSDVYLWAWAYSGRDDPSADYVFSSLMDVDVDEQADYEIDARTPSNPRRVSVVVARFPRAAVADINSA
jgi:hypothetical protein